MLRFKSLDYGTVRWVETETVPALEVEVLSLRNSGGICSVCGRCGSGYDRLPTIRRFEFVPLWGMKVFFVYAPRRICCSHWGKKAERLPWAVNKSLVTEAYAWFLAGWANGCPGRVATKATVCDWKEVAEVFHIRWDTVFNAVEMAVSWGRAHRNLSGIRSIGIDEIAWQ